MHRANEIRPVIKQIAELTEKYHCVIFFKNIINMIAETNGKPISDSHGIKYVFALIILIAKYKESKHRPKCRNMSDECS